MKKRLLSVAVAVALCLTLLPATASAAATSGTFGENMRWSYSTSKKTLTISGSGDIPDYSDWGSRPWENYVDEIESIVIKSGVKRIGDYAFGSEMDAFALQNLKSVTLSNTVTEIGFEAFCMAGNLTSITLPNSLLRIEGGAFYNTPLKKVTIPASTSYIDSSAFLSCSHLEEINVADRNAVYYSTDGVLFGNTESGTELMCYPMSKPSAVYIVPDGTTMVSERAFAWNKSLTAISIPSSVKTIDAMAFLGCENLGKVVLAEGVKKIDSSAFWLCTSLSTLTIPSTVTSMTTEFWPADDWINEGCSFSIHFSGDAPQQFDAGMNLFVSANEGRVTIYYPQSSTGWDALREKFASETLVFKEETGAVPVYSLSEEEILNAAMGQMDFEDLLPEITSEMDTLRGPSITIAGETFYLFEITSKLDIDLGKKGTLQVKADYEKKTVQVLIGYKPVNGSTTIVGDSNSLENSESDFWSAYTNAKSLYKMISGDSADVTSPTFRSKFQDVYDELQEFDMDMIVKAKGKVCGYLELSYETGELKPSEGGMILSVSVEATQNGRIPSFPVAYVTLRFEVSAEGKIRLVFDDDSVSFDPTFDAALNAAIGVGLGDNVGLIQAYIEGGFDGELGAHIRPMGSITGDDPFSVDMTGNLYFSWKLKALVLEDGDTAKIQLFKLGLYPKLEMLSVLDSGQLTMEDFLVSAKPVTRDYLDQVSLMSVTDDYTFSKVEYPYSEPTLTNLGDGRMLMVWVGDSGKKADSDRTSIYYSIFSNGNWSDPKVVWENEAYNDHPVLCQDGDTVYMVWMRADVSIDGMDAEDALTHLDLVYSSYDGANWSDPEIISKTNNGLTETDYGVSADNGTVSVVWIENSENNLLMSTGTNTIHLRSCTDGSWDAETVIFSSSDVITGLDLDSQNGLQVTYSVTNNGETTTYLCTPDGNTCVIDGAEREARWINGDLYELRGTELYCNGVTTGLEGVTNFEIISSNTQNVALTLVSTGFSCELFASYYDAESASWGSWTQLTGFNKYIRSYSATFDDIGKIVVALNLVDVDSDAEQVYDNSAATLVVVDDPTFTDLVVSEWLSYSDSMVIPGGTLPISFQITNNSGETLRNVTATVGGQSQNISCNVSAGESATLTMDYLLPTELSENDITLRVTPGYTTSESNTANNVASTIVGLADLATLASEPVLDEDGGATVTVRVSNNGFADAKNVVLTIYQSNMDGELLCSQDLGTIPAGSDSEYVFHLPTNMLFLDDYDTMNALNFEATSESSERDYANNGDRIVFENLLPLQVNESSQDNCVELAVSIENTASNQVESLLVVAVYGENYKMLDIQVEPICSDAGQKSTISYQFDLSKYDKNISIKVFWLESEKYTPLTPAWEKTYLDGQ